MRSRFSADAPNFRHTEAIRLRPAPFACTCRVCGQLIAQGETSYGWQWRSTESGHQACGWFTVNDADAMYISRRFEIRKVTSDDARRAVFLGLVERRDGMLHPTPLFKTFAKYLAAKKVAS